METPFFSALLLSFVKLFVAVDVVGILPIYTGLVESAPLDKRRGLLRNCLVTGFVTGLAFLLLGQAVFTLIGIKLADFEVAGGLILILIGVIDLLGEEKKLRKPIEEIGIVPLGVPLIVGPAVISVLLLTTDLYGITPSLLSFALNLAIVGLAFYYAPLVRRIFGGNVLKAVSKVMMLLLIAIGVKMIRMGVVDLIHAGAK